MKKLLESWKQHLKEQDPDPKKKWTAHDATGKKIGPVTPDGTTGGPMTPGHIVEPEVVGYTGADASTQTEPVFKTQTDKNLESEYEDDWLEEKQFPTSGSADADNDLDEVSALGTSKRDDLKEQLPNIDMPDIPDMPDMPDLDMPDIPDMPLEEDDIGQPKQGAGSSISSDGKTTADDSVDTASGHPSELARTPKSLVTRALLNYDFESPDPTPKPAAGISISKKRDDNTNKRRTTMKNSLKEAIKNKKIKKSELRRMINELAEGPADLDLDGDLDVTVPSGQDVDNYDFQLAKPKNTATAEEYVANLNPKPSADKSLSPIFDLHLADDARDPFGAGSDPRKDDLPDVQLGEPLDEGPIPGADVEDLPRVGDDPYAHQKDVSAAMALATSMDAQQDADAPGDAVYDASLSVGDAIDTAQVKTGDRNLEAEHEDDMMEEAKDEDLEEAVAIPAFLRKRDDDKEIHEANTSIKRIFESWNKFVDDTLEEAHIEPPVYRNRKRDDQVIDEEDRQSKQGAAVPKDTEEREALPPDNISPDEESLSNTRSNQRPVNIRAQLKKHGLGGKPENLPGVGPSPAMPGETLPPKRLEEATKPGMKLFFEGWRKHTK